MPILQVNDLKKTYTTRFGGNLVGGTYGLVGRNNHLLRKIFTRQVENKRHFLTQ